jgi:hypothetical protein
MRSSAGKYEPSVDELRALFTEAPELADRMRSFRLDRIAKITSGGTPATLQDQCCLVLHVVPFSQFDLLGPSLSIPHIARESHRFPPLRGQASNTRINFDGVFTLSNPDPSASQRAYVQVFRSGTVEAVASVARSSDARINIQDVDQTIVRYAKVYATALHAFGVDPPLAVMATLIGIKGHQLCSVIGQWGVEGEIADRDQMHMIEAILQEVPADNQQAATALRQVIDQLWNAAGRASPLSFDEQGKYLLLL